MHDFYILLLAVHNLTYDNIPKTMFSTKAAMYIFKMCSMIQQKQNILYINSLTKYIKIIPLAYSSIED